jgi:polyisoprenoid-binding protein YceI
MEFTKKIILAFAASFFVLFAVAQAKYSAKDNISLIVSGTSTLHDWDMKSSKGDCAAVFATNAAGALSGLTSLQFSTRTEFLKSDKSAMDKNAYKALKADANPVISFTASAGSVSGSEAAGYQIKSTGKLTIAGTTRDEEIVAFCKVNPDKSITVTGSTKISMKDFGMTPPSFMMGTIKTGNDVVLKFNLTLKK